MRGLRIGKQSQHEPSIDSQHYQCHCVITDQLEFNIFAECQPWAWCFKVCFAVSKSYVRIAVSCCVCVCFPAARSVSLSSWVLCFIEFSVVHCFLLVAMCCFVSLTVSCRLHFCLAFSLLLGCCLFLSLAMSSCVAVYPLDLAGSCWVSLSLSLALSLSILYISCVLQSQQRYKRSS